VESSSVASDSVPAYIRLLGELVRQLERGEFRPGDPFPSEAELCERYGVSRTTVRRALLELMREGRLYRPTPRGRLHVVRTPVNQHLLRFVGFFTEDLLAMGLRHEAQVLAAETVSAEGAPSALGLRPPATAYLVTRLHRAEGTPMALQHSYLPSDLFPDLLAQDLRGSLLELIERHYRRRLVRAVQTLRARLPSRSEQLLLELSPSLPVLVIHRINYDEEDRPVESLESVLPSDRYTLTMELTRPSGA
jgi:GntR family transcriptional regulator